jgi:competence protein ComEC
VSGIVGREPGRSWRLIVSIRRAYGVVPVAWRHPLPDRAVVGAAIVAAVACARPGPAVLVAVVALVIAAAGPRDVVPARVAVLLAAVAVVGAARAGSAWASLSPDELGVYEGWTRLVDDPQPFGSTTRVIVEVEGQRFEVWARGRASRIRVERWRGGDLVLLRGRRTPLADGRLHRVAWQHVVGELRIEWVADTASGGPIDRASNRVRATIEHGAAALPGDDGSLFRGLVIGDDRDQPRAMIVRFRASGLSHLTAVSGQNVSYVLAAAGPLLRVLRPWSRWAVTLALIAWFVSLTRFEPSIVRAGVMAALSATAFVLGRERAPGRILCLAVAVLLIVDPLLVRSVGFWLSVGATAGVATIGPWLAGRLGALGVLSMPVGITLGAQVGVVLPAVLVFGRLPLVSVPANVLAVPVAGFVMLYGLPAGILAGLVPPVAPVVMLPCRVGVRWVDTVALLGERIEPGGAATWIGWGVVVAVVGLIAAMNRGRHGSASADG